MVAEATKVVKIQFQQVGAPRVTDNIKRMTVATKGASSQVNLLRSAMLKLGGIVAFTAALKSATSAALNFGSAMAEVKTLLDDTSQFDKLTKSVKDIALQFGQAPTEQAKALYQIISAGATEASEALDILTVSNKLSIAGVTDVAVAADALTTVLNAYGNQVGSAIDVSDAFFVAVKAGKTTVGELASSIGEVSGVAAQVGVSLEEVLAATAALTKGTLNTARSLRGMRAVMTAIIKPTQEAKDLAEELGIEFSAAGLKSKGFTAFLREVSDATKNNSALLAQLFGNVEGLVPIMALAGTASEDYAEILRQMGDRAGKTNEAFAIMAETAQFKLNRFLTALKIVGIEVGNVLLTVLAPAAEFVANNIDLLTIAISGLAVGLVALNFGAVISGITAFSLALKGLTIAIATNPIGLLVIGVTALVIAVIELNKKFMILDPTWDLIRNGFMLMLNAIQIGFNEFLNWIDSLFAKIKNKLSDFRIGIQETIVFITSKLGSDAALKNVTDALNRLKDTQTDYNKTIQESINKRNETIDLLKTESNQLKENLVLAQKQLFTNRESNNLKKEELGGIGGGDPINDKLNKELAEQERRAERLLKLEKRGKELIQQMRTPTQIFSEQIKELNELYKAGAIGIDTYNRSMKKYQEEMKGSSAATSEFGSLIDSAINGTLKAKDIFLIAVKQILGGLLQMNEGANNTKNAFLDMANSIIGGRGGGGTSLGGILGNIIGSFFAPTPSLAPAPVPLSIPSQPGSLLFAANGAAFNNGIVQKFQKGGVVSKPTAFPMRGGTGLMGETEEEAIMPLQRGPGGRLGVDASGFSQNVTVNVIDQRAGGQAAEVKESSDAQGNKRFSIVIRDEVNKGFAAGSFDKNMKLFGIQRSGTRR